MKRPITDILTLEVRGPEEEVPDIVVGSGAYLHTLLLDPIDLAEVEILREHGYLESYVVLPRTDGAGQYVSALVTTAQLRELGAANETHKLAERGLCACVREEFPSWACTDAGEPAHVFLGVPVTTISGVLT